MACTISYRGRYGTVNLDKFFETLTGEAMKVPGWSFDRAQDTLDFGGYRAQGVRSKVAPTTEPVAPQQEGSHCAKCGASLQ